MNKTNEELKDLLIDYTKGDERAGHEPCDSNHWIRRFYRCYIDGSYKGSRHYESNCENVREALKLTAGRKKVRLTMLARTNFREFLQVEFPDSKNIGKLIAETLTERQNELLTKELVDDLVDLVRE